MTDPVHNSKHRKGLPTAVKFMICIGVIAALFLAGYIPKRLNSDRLNAQAKKVAATAPVVQTTKAKYTPLPPITLPGTLNAIFETSVQARTTGYVTKLYVDIGARVKAGQLLADVKAPDVGEQYFQANAQTNQSRSVLSESQATAQSLNANVVADQATVVHQQAALEQAEAALDAAKAATRQAMANLMAAKEVVANNEQLVIVQKAAMNQAEANYTLGSANLKRQTQLLKEGFTNQQDYDTAAETFKSDEATIESTKASYQAAVGNVRSAQDTVKANEEAVRSAEAAEKEASANVRAAKATLESSIATLNAAKSNLTAGLETVNANMAGVSSSVANERRYGVLYGFTHLYAPFDGIITSRNVDVGSLISPGAISSADATNPTPTSGLFGIARIDILRVYVNLPQSDYKWASQGTNVDVEIEELPKRKFVGEVHQTAGALDTTTRTRLAEVRIPNPKGELLPGMYAEVELSSKTAKDLRIPDNAILFDSKGTRVILVDSTNHLHYKNITVGRDFGTESEVLKGVTTDDRMVVNASDNFQEGEVVQVQQPKKTRS